MNELIPYLSIIATLILWAGCEWRVRSARQMVLKMWIDDRKLIVHGLKVAGAARVIKALEESVATSAETPTAWPKSAKDFVNGETSP